MSVPANEYRPMARLDFAWIGEAWRMFTALPGTWIGAVALYTLTLVLVMAILAVPTGLYAYMVNLFRTIEASGGGATPPGMTPHGEMLRFLPFSLILAAVEAVLNGGMYRMAIRQYRGESINVGGIFSAFNVSWQLIVIALVLAMVNEAVVFVQPNLGWVVSIILEGLFFLAPLRIVDKRVGPIQALVDNLMLLRGQRWLGFFFYVFLYLIMILGSCCIVGIVVTLPLFILTQGVSYMMMTEPRLPAAPEYGQPIEGVWPPPPNLGQ
jgi:hypothetical protein